MAPLNPLFRYSFYSLTIDSEIELSGLLPGAGEPDLVIRIGLVPDERRTTMTEEVGFHRVATRFLVRNGSEIVIDPVANVDPFLLQGVLTGRLMAYVMRQRGWIPLHGSAVVIGGRAAVFLGESGSGKSTTAAAFHAAGHWVVTDDLSPLRPSGGKVGLCAGSSRLKLLAESRAVLKGRAGSIRFEMDKYSCDVTRGALQSEYPVGWIYVLDYGESAASRPIPQPEAVSILDSHSIIRRPAMDYETRAGLFDLCAAVAAMVPVSRLIRTRRQDALPAVVRLVEQDMAHHG